MLEFIRYGGLSPVKQIQYETNTGFHNPPKRKGIYAFVYPYIDLFLIGSTSDVGHISNKSAWLKDRYGNLIKSDDFFTDEWKNNMYLLPKPKYITLLKERNIKYKHLRSSKKNDVYYVSYIKKPHTFTYSGLIWHHLYEYVKPIDIIESNGSWVKTTMKVYEEALNKIISVDMKDLIKIEKYGGLKYQFPNKINPYIGSGTRVSISKDHLEVFFERI